MSFYAPVVGENTLNVLSSPAGTQLGVVAGNGDQITLGSRAPNLGGTVDGIRGHILLGPVVVNGGATVIVDDSGNAGTARDVRITSSETLGTVYGRIDGLTPGGITFQDLDEWTVNIRGGAANDRFLMSGPPLVTTVDIDGGAGNDVLVGSGGNILRGGVGRDLLIAGAVASQLFGGGDDDLLLGGTTVHDQNPTNLSAIMAEWTSGAEYETRVQNLRNGLLGTGAVTTNGGQNTLFGENDRDFFFASLLDQNDGNHDELFVWL